MISYSNSCDAIFLVHQLFFPRYDGLILHDATIFQPIIIPAKGSYNAKGTEMLMSLEKFYRLHSSSAGMKNLDQDKNEITKDNLYDYLIGLQISPHSYHT